MASASHKQHHAAGQQDAAEKQRQLRLPAHRPFVGSTAPALRRLVRANPRRALRIQYASRLPALQQSINFVHGSWPTLNHIPLPGRCRATGGASPATNPVPRTAPQVEQAS
jgi:hypothetical protein